MEDRWLSFRGRIEIFISILPEDLKVFRYTHEEKLTLPKFGIALKGLSAYDRSSFGKVGVTSVKKMTRGCVAGMCSLRKSRAQRVSARTQERHRRVGGRLPHTRVHLC